jgi:hypothetical protein
LDKRNRRSSFNRLAFRIELKNNSRIEKWGLCRRFRHYLWIVDNPYVIPGIGRARARTIIGNFFQKQTGVSVLGTIVSHYSLFVSTVKI